MSSPERPPASSSSSPSSSAGSSSISPSDANSPAAQVSERANATALGIGVQGHVRRLAVPLAVALLTAYVTAVASELLPVQLLVPAWQLKLVAVLVNNVGFALTAVFVMALAMDIAPTQRSIAQGWQRIQAWAPAVSLLFLLLIPLQLSAVWSNYRLAVNSQQEAISRIEAGHKRFRLVVQTAPTGKELQAALAFNQVGAISDADTAIPLPLLRRNLLAAGETTRQRALAGVGRVSRADLLKQLPDVLRIVLTALAAAEVFGAVSVPPRGLLRTLFRRPLGDGGQAAPSWRRRLKLWKQSQQRFLNSNRSRADRKRRAREVESLKKKRRSEAQRSSSSRRP